MRAAKRKHRGVDNLDVSGRRQLAERVGEKSAMVGEGPVEKGAGTGPVARGLPYWEILGKTSQCYRFPVARIVAFLRAALGRDQSAPGSWSRLKVLSFLAILGAGLVLWWWPGLTGQGGESEITIVSTPEMESTRQDISRRVREEGFSVQWLGAVNTWCDVRDSVGLWGSTMVVLLVDGLDDCEIPTIDIIAGLDRDNRLSEIVIVSIDDASSPAFVERLSDGGARLVATQRLIGGIDEELPCVWWEDCDLSGRTVTRTATGLTPDGRDRLARLITAAVV